MNERIKDMMKEATKTNLFEFASWEMTVSENGKEYNIPLEFCERFAELIVRECAEVAADHDALDIYEEIREHFGVES